MTKLTAFAGSGGCGCKISAGVLRQWLAPLHAAVKNNDIRPMKDGGDDLPVGGKLLVGGEFCDDAAVWRVGDDSAIVASADFFAPVVDDAADFGAIAAANALSDIYAMGARPLFALALTAMPEAVDNATVKQILQGGADICQQAGVVVAGGHSIRNAEPLYGLCAIGSAHPDKILTNGNAQPGDILILGKPLGAGLLSAAHRGGKLPQQQYATMTATMKTLNSAGLPLAALAGAHSLTDITGFGMLGHLLEMCRASGIRAQLDFDKLPLMDGAIMLAKKGGTGGGKRNWQDCQNEVIFDGADWQREILCDPQTSGGLLLACAPDVADDALALFYKHNCGHAAVVGRCLPPDANNKGGVIAVKT
ncbi:MAG: selenide, water dikinase SelD [Gammaproteobacteria bacterium]